MLLRKKGGGSPDNGKKDRAGTKGYTGYRGHRRGEGRAGRNLLVVISCWRAAFCLLAALYGTTIRTARSRFEFPWIKITGRHRGGDSGFFINRTTYSEITVQKAKIIKGYLRSRAEADALGGDWQRRSMALRRERRGSRAQGFRRQDPHGSLRCRARD